MSSIPDFIEVNVDEQQIRVRFAYDAGEDMTRDHPGCPPSLEITDVDFGNGWEPVETYPQLNLEQIEQDIWDEIQKVYDKEANDYAEAWAETQKAYAAWDEELTKQGMK